MKKLTLAVTLLLASVQALANGIDGKWTGSVDTPNGAIPIAYEFKSNGTSLTGSTNGPDGKPIPVQDGKVDGDKVSFSLTMQFGPEPATFVYTGVVTGKVLKLQSEVMGQPIEFTLNKAD